MKRDFPQSADSSQDQGPTPTHDDLIKRLLHRPRLLREFFRAFVPEIARFADLEHLEYLDKEHPRGRRSPRRYGDVLVKTRWQGKQEAAFLIHIESQSKPQDVALQRLVEYAMRDSIRYRVPVMPVLLLTYAEPEKVVPNTLRWQFGKAASLQLHCPVLHFRRMDPRPHLQSRNVAALALSALMKLDQEEQVEAIVQTIAEALRQRLRDEDLEAAVDFVQFYAELEEGQLLQFEQRAAILAKKERILSTMTKLVNNWERTALKRGISQGISQGELQVTQRQIQRKFPLIAKKAGVALAKLSEERLLSFAEALLFMETEKDCLDWLKANA